ncbi:zinc-dependent metalloprotease [Nonlabens sp.]|uniref:zinc-dependent metalloprotease n=1 Tax=Nonlabens sp. TaxID=1888209 RepID=UPI0025E14D72|nr:zinc-dependent metalloprotease [Nonlabens sp.]
MKSTRCLLSLLFLISAFAKAQSTLPPQQFKGYYDFSYQEDKGSILLEVKDLDKEFLYVHSLTSGLGSNDIGLDRGQLGDGVVVKWIKSGNKLLLLQPNLTYRASSINKDEKASIEQAFAKSVLFGFEIQEHKNGTYVIDLTPFLMQDAHGVATRLKDRKQGIYKLDKTRSVLWIENTKSFPKNTEFEAMLTFTGTPAGSEVKSIAPDASSISVIQHHSFVELPDAGYQPRVFHPRSGSFYMSYMDYSTPVFEPIQKRLITRHRLEKKNPELAISEPVAPIIYYLDRGTPDPVRSALLEGAGWWNEAFESAGYKNAFQVKMLPEGADPMDLRYNVIQWVHRSTRGWSYGGSITDPRTGEIIKGHVSLGSLRIRQDFMIAQGLLKEPFKENDKNHEAMMDMALARIRQLGAHEVGHTLGFAHNFAASTQDRASVMDYPHPKYDLVDGVISLGDAYDVGIGRWDNLTVQYSYGSPKANQSEAAFLQSIINIADVENLKFISDSDSRAAGGASASGHLWDNGANPSEELIHILKVREIAMNQFSLDNIRSGEALSVLEDVFVPVYFAHRYQVEATTKLVGGLEYEFLTKDGNEEFKTVGAFQQVEALRSILKSIDPETLKIPQSVLKLFPPRAYGYARTRESFQSETGVGFDPLNAAATSVGMTFDLLFHPERMNRITTANALVSNNFKEVKNINDFKDASNAVLTLGTLLNAVSDHVFTDYKNDDPYATAIAHRAQELFLNHLMNLTASSRTNIDVKAAARNQLKKIEKDLSKRDLFENQLLMQINTFYKHPELFEVKKLPSIPDGSPIGCGYSFK